eukprot:g24678.t1
MADGKDFQYPAFYQLPPFFTLQPHASVRAKQLELWKQLISEYCSFHRLFIINLREERSMQSLMDGEAAEGQEFYGAPRELIMAALQELVRRNRATLFRGSSGSEGVKFLSAQLLPGKPVTLPRLADTALRLTSVAFAGEADAQAEAAELQLIEPQWDEVTMFTPSKKRKTSVATVGDGAWVFPSTVFGLELGRSRSSTWAPARSSSRGSRDDVLDEWLFPVKDPAAHRTWSTDAAGGGRPRWLREVQQDGGVRGWLLQGLELSGMEDKNYLLGLRWLSGVALPITAERTAEWRRRRRIAEEIEKDRREGYNSCCTWAD